MNPCYVYNALVTKVVDGDTADLDVHLGFKMTAHIRVRFYGINAPETRGKERPLGLQSKKWVKDLIEGRVITIKTHKTGKYGRWLAELYIPGEEESINDQMVRLGLAREYMKK